MDYKYIPLVGTGVFALIAVVLFVYLFIVKMKRKSNEKNFDEQLDFSINPEKERVQEVSLITKWSRVLPELMITAEMVKENTTIEDIQKKILLVGGVVFTLTTLLAKNPIAGLLPTLLLYIGVRVFAMYKVGKKKTLMDEQIPAFISVFKANIQANQHAQNAMINAINNTANPLHEELARSKSIMEAGDFRPGIVALRMSTENETLRQMASCIELASSSGSNIEEQIETIEGIIESKQAIERKKRLGVNENKPLFLVAGLMIPVSFIGSYFMSDMHREYWFTTPLSYLILVGVVISVILSSWATWKVIQQVDIG